MSSQTFTAQVSAFVARSKGRLDAVVRESVQRLVEDMQIPVGAGGNMPVDTGYLRSSLQITDTPPMVRAGAPGAGQSYSYNEAAISLQIAGMPTGKVTYLSYGASYAAAVEFGARGRPGRAFARLAAQKWPSIVVSVCNDLHSRVSGNTPGT